MLNKCMFIGHCGKDPEVRRLNSGAAVVSFSLAVSERWKDKQTGERKEKTEWVNVVIFNEALGKIAEQYLKKGSKCFVEGQLQTRKWKDQQGNDRYSTEIVLQNFRGAIELLDGPNGGDRGEAGASAAPAASNSYADRKNGAAPAGGYAGDLDDSIPF
jgi:single-strand DNA-binding protein